MFLVNFYISRVYFKMVDKVIRHRVYFLCKRIRMFLCNADEYALVNIQHNTILITGENLLYLLLSQQFSVSCNYNCSI